MYKELGGEIITTGSDSHTPSQIAVQFDYIYSYLKDIGLNSSCYVSSVTFRGLTSKRILLLPVGLPDSPARSRR